MEDGACAVTTIKSPPSLCRARFRGRPAEVEPTLAVVRVTVWLCLFSGPAFMPTVKHGFARYPQHSCYRMISTAHIPAVQFFPLVYVHLAKVINQAWTRRRAEARHRKSFSEKDAGKRTITDDIFAVDISTSSFFRVLSRRASLGIQLSCLFFHTHMFGFC